MDLWQSKPRKIVDAAAFAFPQSPDRTSDLTTSRIVARRLRHLPERERSSSVVCATIGKGVRGIAEDLKEGDCLNSQTGLSSK